MLIGTTQLSQPIPCRNEQPTQATVSSASSITLQTLQLTPTGSFKQITLEGTASSEGIMVYLLGTNYVAMTDDQGNYTFTGVPVGTYALKATFDGFESQNSLRSKSILRHLKDDCSPPD